MRAWLRSLLLVLLPLPALAAPPASPVASSPAQFCETAIAAAGLTARLPERMMQAIAVVETGRPDDHTGVLRPWPWTINAEGQGFFFADKQQAIAAVRALQARGVRSIDVGCMQINLMFHPTAFVSLDQAFDPQANALYAAKFLNALYTASHDWPTTIAAYHSETPAVGADYRRRVMARWDRPNLSPSLAHYADFSPRSARYQDFAPRTQVYGAFANAFDAQPTASTIR
jgi:hypothetical protein